MAFNIALAKQLAPVIDEAVLIVTLHLAALARGDDPPFTVLCGFNTRLVRGITQRRAGVFDADTLSQQEGGVLV
jgi:hypothetical protein